MGRFTIKHKVKTPLVRKLSAEARRLRRANPAEFHRLMAEAKADALSELQREAQR